MTVAGLALRELWISYRLVAVLAAFVLPAVLIVFLPDAPAASLGRLGLGLMGAATIAGALVAWSFAAERRRGRAAWLVSRAVPRSTLLAGWLLAGIGSVLAGLAPAGLLAWVALAGARDLDPLAYAAALGAVAASGVALIALGLLAGTLLQPLLASGLLVVAGAGVGVAVLLVHDPGPTLPGAGFAALGALAEVSRPVARALQSAGVSLAASAAVVAACLAALERRDL